MHADDVKRLDAKDPLASIRDQFYLPEGTVYLDGNSLGPMSHAAQQRVAEVTRTQWGEHLITSWNRHKWINLPLQVGDKIGGLIGAAPGQVICCDSISVNLFKVLAAALQLRPERSQVLSTEDNFPTDLYMAEGLQQLLGQERCELVLSNEATLSDAISDKTAVVMVTEVNFRSGRRLDIERLTRVAHEQGAIIIVDLAHSAGVMPVELDHWDVDFAVGCTYKYMNGGPGAPAFLYSAERLHGKIKQPLCGWMGHSSPFDFTPAYEPASGIKAFLAGTPSVISMSAVDAALDAFSGVSLSSLRNKSMQLSTLFNDLIEQYKLTEIMQLISPAEAEQRGSQLSYQSEYAYGICQALIERDVIADFRAPNYLRFGFAPLYNNFADIWHAVRVLRDVVASEAHLDKRWQQRNAVT
ncbi:kynureninase [Aliidiomarina sp. Khilg15.8]